MSAYGTITVSGRTSGRSLGARLYRLRQRVGSDDALAFIHFDGAAVPAQWKQRMHQIFDAELAEGKT